MEKVFVVTFEGYSSKLNDFVTYVIGVFRTIESASKVIDEARDRHRKDDVDMMISDEWIKDKLYRVRYKLDPDECNDYDQDIYFINETELAD